MNGPDHYRRAEQLLAEASELNRFRPQLTYSGPDDVPMRDTDMEQRRRDMEQRRRLSEDPGLPDRNIAEAHVHATLALAAATALAATAALGRNTQDAREWNKAAATMLNPYVSDSPPVRDNPYVSDSPPVRDIPFGPTIEQDPER
jgi:hypothetical protein